MHSHLRGVVLGNTWSREQPKCPSVSERIHKMWLTHRMEYDPALKRKEILTPG